MQPAPYTLEIYIEGQKVQTEIDTGASVTIIRENAVKTLPNLSACNSVLRTYTGEPIRVLGKCFMKAQYGDKIRTLPVYVIPGDRPNLLGRDWIRAFPDTMNVVKLVTEISGLETLLKQHSAVFSEELGKLKEFQAAIKLKEGARPKFIKACTLPYAMRPKVEEELKRLQTQDIITPVHFSDWGTPIVPVTKPDGSVRICGDYKITINQASMLVRYPLPRIDDLYATLASGEKFTKLDLSHAYSQIELDEPSRKLTNITTHMGLFQYTRLPFGIISAPGRFQSIIDDLVKDIPFACAYLDDILIFGRSDTEHLRTLAVVLERLERSAFRLKRSKCEFLSPSVCYLGYRLDKHALHVLNDKLKPILERPEPKSCDELRSFLGMLSHYRRFLPNASTVLSPLNELLHKNASWCWGSCQKDAFNKAKQALASPPTLVHFDSNKPLILQCDAPPWGVGAVLCHRMDDGSLRPIAYASRTLQTAEKNYSQLDREALAVIFGVKRFHQYLWGNVFERHKDHKPLISLFGETKGIQQMASPRMQRWAITLSAYSYKIVYITGVSNCTADALSRLPITETAHEHDPPFELVNLRQHLDTTPIRSSTIRQRTDRDPRAINGETLFEHGLAP
ncbi:unnamed protein product [Dicrocoelium dendriticum]|nr:unnamed protein product [Dicrocoelium dendriticum]